VNVQPWFPGALGRWKWLNEAIPAERLAALRIAAALAVLVDICFCYLPHFTLLFSPDFLGGRDLCADRFRDSRFYWSVLRVLPDAWGPAALFGAWAASAVGLLLGWRTLFCGLVCWACAVSLWGANPLLHNGGDRVRHSLLLLVALSACAEVWSVRGRGAKGVLVPGWVVKVLLVQLACIYFFSGWAKLQSPIWRNGFVMYWVAHDLAWSQWPWAGAQVPVWVLRLSALITMLWELLFPVLVLWPRGRAFALALGAAFHVATLFTLEVGMFAFYSLACYAPFVPWERLRRA
jgi:Vitamin K-dependent gamma-carboxylase